MTNNSDRSPVAVIGFSFRVPGGTDEALWQALLAGRSGYVGRIRPMVPRLPLASQQGGTRDVLFVRGGFHWRRRRVRRGLFWHFAAGSRANGSAATGVA